MLESCASGNSKYSEDTLRKLSKSFYVDNCVTSVVDEETLKSFIQESSMLMAAGKFDLRGWEHSHQNQDKEQDATTAVLGLKWNKSDDTLSISQDNLGKDGDSSVVTKRLMLSLSQKIFDPIGFTCPATLTPKLLLQKTWQKNSKWDDPVDPATRNEFQNWIKGLKYLYQISIPRWIYAGRGDSDEWTLHVFCDASKEAFSAVVFLRSVQKGEVCVRLLSAKSRVAPLRKLSIPRLELMAAVIAARLYNSVKENFEIDFQSYFWSDSTTVLSWIRRDDEWATFVWNRVTEIRSITSKSSWRFIHNVNRLYTKVNRFIHNVKNPNEKIKGELTSEEIDK